MSVGRSELSYEQIQAIIGLSKAYAAGYWVKNQAKIEMRESERRGLNGQPLKEVGFTDVERALVALLPANFPYFNGEKDQSWSQTLIVVPSQCLPRATWQLQLHD